MTHFYAICKAQLTGLYVKHDSTVEIKTKNDSTWIRRPFSCRETVIWKLQAYCTAYNDGYFSSGSWQFCSSVIVKKSNMQQWRHEVIRWRHMSYDIWYHMSSYDVICLWVCTAESCIELNQSLMTVIVWSTGRWIAGEQPSDWSQITV